jgi:hypothetical protein
VYSDKRRPFQRSLNAISNTGGLPSNPKKSLWGGISATLSKEETEGSPSSVENASHSRASDDYSFQNADQNRDEVQPITAGSSEHYKSPEEMTFRAESVA